MLFLIGQLLILTAPGCFIPVILTLTPDQSAVERVRVAFVACFVATLVLTAFALFGNYVLKFFGFSLSAFKIAGGSYLMIVGFELLFDDDSEEKSVSDAPREETRKYRAKDVAITPLGIPLLVGPGMISVIVAKCAETATLSGRLLLICAIVIAFVAFFTIVSMAMFGVKYIGEFVLDVAGKFTGMYAVAVGFLICFSGITAFART
ncbi:MAG: MarC family protein [Puniceicoccales bacterium]|jgi:multiple antibiotic resistance protein|nr:MarC family protein [Puniceicoccales bacterium]